jgi:hypothetical protein
MDGYIKTAPLFSYQSELEIFNYVYPFINKFKDQENATIFVLGNNKALINKTFTQIFNSDTIDVLINLNEELNITAISIDHREIVDIFEEVPSCLNIEELSGLIKPMVLKEIKITDSKNISYLITELNNKFNKKHLVIEIKNLKNNTNLRIVKMVNYQKKLEFDLRALENVLKGLEAKSEVIRYKLSKLTWYLKESFGGNSNTLIIGCIYDSITSNCNSLELSISQKIIELLNIAKKIPNKIIKNAQKSDFYYATYLVSI